MWLHVDADWRWFGLGGNWQDLDEATADDYWLYYLEISGTFSKASTWEARNRSYHYFYDPPYEWYVMLQSRGVAHSIIEKVPF